MKPKTHKELLAVSIILLVCATSSALSAQPPSYFKISLHGHEGEPAYEYLVKAERDDLIGECRDQLSMPVEERRLHINGALDYGNGGFNRPWSWHIVPDEWVLAEMSIELCDGIPQFVESDLQYWVETVRYYCCWSSYIGQEMEKGDVNGDGIINILDVMRAVNIILELGPAPIEYDLWAADMDVDGDINVLDVVRIVMIILGG